MSILDRFQSDFPELNESNVNIRVFKFSLFDEDKLSVYLSEDERKRMNKLRIINKRVHFIVTRALLRISLSHYLDIEPKDIVFNYGKHGRPELKASSITFNVSHSGGYGLLAITLNNFVGVDIEKLDPTIDCCALAKRFFSEAENHILSSTGTKNKTNTFYRIWTRKEAFVKANGKGIAYGPTNFSVATGESNEYAETKITTPNEQTAWYSYDLASPDFYHAALVAAKSDLKLSQQQFID